MRIPWVFDGYEFPVNPAEDSGWTKETSIAESNAIRSTSSTFHWTGTKSARRTVSGYFFGPSSSLQRGRFKTWYEQRKQALLTDHTGESRKAQMISFTCQPVRDVRSVRTGAFTWQYTAEFIEV